MRVAKPTADPHPPGLLSRAEVYERTLALFYTGLPGESRGPSFHGTSQSPLARRRDCFKKFRGVEEWIPAFAGKARLDLPIASHA
jgi:hypothetical protein